MTPLDVACPLCHAQVGAPCRSQTGSGHRPKHSHKARSKKAERLAGMTWEHDENGLVIVDAVAVWSGRVWVLEFRCPWCGRTHTHGGGSGRWPDGDGSRVTHCHAPDAPQDYTIRTVEVVRREP
jgi:hypothetical protein